MDIETVAAELYATAPEDFVAVREERVKQARSAGQRDLAGQIRGLRKPTTGAWVVNLLARELSEEIDRLLALGEQLREAQSDLRGDELRMLSRQRTQVVSALARQGRRLAGDAGHRVSEAVEREVEGTLEAALADPEAAGAVRSGRLAKALSYSGFGGVDLSGAVAAGPRPPSGPRPRRPGHRPDADVGAEREDARGEQAEREQAEHERLRRDLAEAEDEAGRADGAEAEARGREDDARSRRDAAGAARDLHRASRDTERAQRHAAGARRRVERARARLDSHP